ncbi:dicarboxylate/amino acid:cation symporter [Acidicapsa ligni]|uniref:dicarboxylate/amino acid:cation symporter n=1 Tax=Acidicapsa ligni TaxID=542300 RepID=UPI0021E02CEB|nr:cation:dicarboxylase symporter family transporter [Acidicapsa ligni]
MQTPKKPSRRTSHLLSLAGLLSFAIGIASGWFGVFASAAVYLRWSGLILFVPFLLRKRSLMLWTFFAMIVGSELGADFPGVASQTHFLGEIFLRLIRVIVAPLIFATITTGIAGHDHLGGVGRVALKALIYFEAVTTLGLLIGTVAMNLSRAGVGIVLPAFIPSAPVVATEPGWQQLILNIFPENIALAVAQNQILQVAVFSIAFGIALAQLPQEKRVPLISVLQSLADTMLGMTRIIMYAAPVAAGAALAFTVGGMGLATLLPLLKLVATYYAALTIFLLLVLVPILLISRIPLRRFIAAIAEPAAIGFATTTSEAALPLALERMEAFGVPRWIASFVIPAGYSFNMDGSSIYLSMAAIFAAQAAGISLSVGQQILMLATLLLASKGVAGVPRAVLVILLATANSLHIPTAPILMILGVDTLMDMGRTSMNVIGNCMASAVVAQWEGELNVPSQTAIANSNGGTV